MTGDHGAVDISGYVNSRFITVTAGPGQKPSVKAMKLTASSHWLFRGLEFRSIRPPADANGPLIGLGNSEEQGPSDNLIFMNNAISTDVDTALWSDQDWVDKPYKVALATSARCVAILDNHFYNLRDAIAVGGDDTLVADNLIENFGNDGIDVIASNVRILRNRITHGRHTPTEPLHADAIQGWTNEDRTNRRLLVEENWIENLNSRDDNYLQGISIFDGKWDGVVIQNNVVITHAFHGVALYGVDNAVVINNTVIPARIGDETWITIRDSQETRPSHNVVLRNNIAAKISASGQSISFDHNVASQDLTLETGDVDGQSRRADVSPSNRVDAEVFTKFARFSIAAGVFDLRPTQQSPAFRAGSATLAPRVDVLGRMREAPYDIGALAR